jgi:hypothetical protein
MSTPATAADVPDAVRAAADAYVYGYPLVYGLGEASAFVAGGDRFPTSAPYNQFGHVRDLADSHFHFVSPNNDTVYSIAICDVRPSPLVLHVPDTAGRYYVLQFIDAWTNNFAYLGRRATGTSEQQFLLTPPGWAGAVPPGMTQVAAPSGVFVIGGRTQVNGKDDLPAVHALQDQFTLTPLESGAATPAGIPQAPSSIPDDLRWWEEFRLRLAAFPAPESEHDLVASLAPLGVTSPDSPYASLDAAHAQVLIEGAKLGQATIEKLMMNVHHTPAGWQMATHIFDYNVHYFGPGTINSPDWTIADPKTRYATRAVAARAGLWGNHGYEASYGLVWIDGEGQPLDGSHKYTLRLDPPPPVEAFWSLTMYDVPDFYLIANPINRYSIGDRTPGLQVDDDGSVTLFIQADSPGAEHESNWLPSPTGPFRPALRMYQPKQAVLDGSYVVPPIVRVD